VVDQRNTNKGVDEGERTPLRILDSTLQNTVPRLDTAKGYHSSGLYYHAACPPSILRSAPVMNDEASLIRNTAAPRYSRG